LKRADRDRGRSAGGCVGARQRGVDGGGGKRGDRSAHRHADRGVRADLRLGDLRIARVVGGAGDGVQVQPLLEVVIHLQGEDVVVGAEEVLVREAEVAAAVDGRRQFVEEPRQTVVGCIGFGEVYVAERSARGGVQSGRDRRRDAEAADLGGVALGHSRFDRHGVHAEGGAVADLGQGLVDVGGDAAGEVGAELRLHIDEFPGLGNLALLVDDAAGRAAAELDSRRAFEHVDLLIVERIAVVAAEVADSVQEDVVARGEAADGQVVALRAGFAGRQRNPRDVAQRILERGHALVREHELRDDGNRLRRVDQRLAELLHGDRVREPGDDVDRIAVAQADLDQAGAGDLEAEAGIGEQQAQGYVRGVEPGDARRVEAVRHTMRQGKLHLQAGDGLELLQCGLERGGRNVEPLGRKRARSGVRRGVGRGLVGALLREGRNA
jgi:hypothetical protein